MTDNMRGAVLMLATMACFTANDAFMKSLAPHLPLFQALALRGLGSMLLLGLIAWQQGALHLPAGRRDRALIVWRTLAEAAAACFFFLALFNLPLATTTAIIQVVPLALALSAALFLGEPIGWRRLVAIGIGFGGVLLIVRPGGGGGGVDIFALSALASVVCVTARDLVTRQLSPSVPSLGVALATAIGVTLIGTALSLTRPWAPVGPPQAAALAGAVVFVMLGYLLSVMVMRVGEVGFVQSFRYSSLVWALLLGLVVFDEWPDALTLVGAGIIAATGIFTLLREQAAARRRRRQGA
jgi:S-adenosylmethionine uptake transporter